MLQDLIANKDILKIGVPTLLGIISTLVAYRLGKKSRKDEQTIARRLELGERIVVLYQEVVDLEEHFFEFFKKNYGHLYDIERAIENFEKMNTLYQPEYEKIDLFSDKQEELVEKLKEGRYHFKAGIISRMQEYTGLLDIGVTKESAGLFNTYHRQFFLNITDPNLRKKRAKINQKIKKRLKQLSP